MTPPAAFGVNPWQGGDASGPAKPVPRHPRMKTRAPQTNEIMPETR